MTQGQPTPVTPQPSARHGTWGRVNGVNVDDAQLEKWRKLMLQCAANNEWLAENREEVIREDYGGDIMEYIRVQECDPRREMAGWRAAARNFVALAEFLRRLQAREL